MTSCSSRSSIMLSRSSFFFSSRRRHTRWPRDWSSDVCSSDLAQIGAQLGNRGLARAGTLPYFAQQVIFALNIGQLSLVVHTLQLYFQNGELVQQLAGGDGEQQVHEFSSLHNGSRRTARATSNRLWNRQGA